MYIFPRDAKRARGDVVVSFMGHFSSLGYITVKPEPLVPSQDAGFLCTGASIVALKPSLRTSIPEPGYCISQPCLRSRNLVLYDSLDFNPGLVSYFQMVSILANMSQESLLPETVCSYLVNTLSIPLERMRIQTSSLCDKFHGPWLDLGIKHEQDTRNAKSYEWNYGCKDIRGAGFNIYIVQPNQPPLGFCNVVQVCIDGEPIGYEFGFAVETLLSEKYSLRGTFEASTISMAIPFDPSPLAKQIQDLVVSAVTLSHVGIRSGRKGVGGVLRRTLVQLERRLRLSNISLDYLSDVALVYERIEYGTDEGARRLVESMRKREKMYSHKKEKFICFVAKQLHLLHAGSLSEPEFIDDRIRQYGRRKCGFSEEQLDNILCEVQYGEPS